MVLAVLPAASSAVTVTVFLPVCNCIVATVHVANRDVPLNAAVPEPPRSLAQRTR
jgi:hypothetical protein